jgi:NAD(P)-dependent dehydrogenase (short-subunit alcohol dehydrogenase family)
MTEREEMMSTRMQVQLDAQAGIITGAGTGMGREVASRLAGDGAALLLSDINGDTLDQTVQDIKRSGGEASAFCGDVSLERDVEEMITACMKAYGKIDFLVSNAGIVGPYEFSDTSADDWDRVFAVNTRGGFLCSRAVLPVMKEQQSGRIIFNASTNGGKPGGYVIAYRASKAALIMLARSLALNAAPHGITVNAVCPGVTMTPMQRQLTESLIEGKGVRFEEYVEERKKRIPLGRFTEVGDIADIIEFLVSDNASYITGQTLYVNGGEW